TGQQADDNRECDGSNHQPPRYKPNLFWRKVEALQIHVGTEVNNSSDGPAQRDAHESAEHAHHASLRKEQSFDIAVTGADGFHDSDFAAALENCHHQRIDDSNG